MDGPFTAYQFKVDVAEANQVARNLPARLSEIVNVKDHGAVGDGVHDDTPNIHAAIAYAWSVFFPFPTIAGVTIYFPPGTYFIGTPPLILDRDATIEGHKCVCAFVGAGREATIIKGTHYTGEQPEHKNNSFLVHFGALNLDGTTGNKNVGTIRNLTIWNESTGIASGALIVGGSGNAFSIDNCHLRGFIGYVHDIQTFGTTITNCILTCTKPITAANAATRSPLFNASNFLAAVSYPTPPGRCYGSIGMAINQGFIANCIATGFDIGFDFMSYMLVMGNKAVQCGIGFTGGYQVGTPGLGELGEAGFPSAVFPGRAFSGSLVSNRTERCTWGIFGAGGIVASNVMTGADGPYIPAAISGMTWNVVGSNVVEVTTVDPHNLTAGAKLVIVPATWTPVPTRPIVSVTSVTSGTKFTYPGPSSAPPAFVSGSTWNYAREYGINLTQSSASDVTMTSNICEAPVAIADFTIGDQSDAYRSIVMCMRAQYGWSLGNPANAGAPAWQMWMCNTPYIITYAGLVATFTPPASMEVSISDGSGSTAFGATITGSGSGRYKIRLSTGTTWTRVG